MKTQVSRKLVLPVILIAALLLPSCAPQATPTTEPAAQPTDQPQIPATGVTETAPPELAAEVTFRLSWTKEGTYASYYLAKEKGFFAEEGLDVEILEGSGSGTSVQSVAANDATFAMADGTAVLSAVQEGTPAITVATINQLSPYGLICRKDANVNTVEDVAGKRVIFPGGSGQALVFPAFLRANNVDPAEVTVVNGDSPTMIPAIIQGEVDCAVDFAAAFIAFANQQAPDLEFTTFMFGDYGANTVSQGIVTHTDTVAEHPDWVTGFVSAVLRANQYTVDHVDEAIDALLKDSPELNRETETELLRAAISTWHPNTSLPWGCSHAPDWTFSENLLLEEGVVSETLPLDQYYTNEFVPEECP